MDLSRNRQLVDQAREIAPGGVASPVRAYRDVEGDPLVVDHAGGAEIVDPDGNTYIDLVSAYGAIALGHGHPAVADACQRAAATGLNTGTPSPEAVQLTQRLVDARPAAEWMRFVNSGTEAVMSALRLARGATGRDGILKFEGCYHGHWDPLLVEAGSGVDVHGEGTSAGVPEALTDDTAVLPLDDEAALETYFADHGETTAAAVIEPVVANSGLLPQRGAFLQRLAELCREHGTLLVFDEIATGFRYGPGGIAERVDVDPDLVTLGKTIGGGLPIGAYGGREDLREHVSPEGDVYQAGTASANRIAMAAGHAVLDELDADAYERLARVADRLAREGTKALAPAGARIRSHGPLAWLTFAPEPLPRHADVLEQRHERAYAAFRRAALAEGLHLPPGPNECLFPTLAHTDPIVDDVLRRLANAAERVEAPR
jgi:glutamate-1-semialdehyde 2,1-aminomutase